MAEAGIVRDGRDRRRRKRAHAQQGRNGQDFIDSRLHVNPAMRPPIDPWAEAGFIFRGEREQHNIAPRAGVGTVPLPFRRNSFRQPNTSCIGIDFAEKSIQTTVTDDGHVAEIAHRAGVGTVPLPFRRNSFRQPNTSCIEIDFAEKSIRTTVTDDGHVAENWVNQQRGQEIVGFDLEWKPNFQKGSDHKTALLQLCTDNGCLIIQMLFLDFIPEALVRFLKDPGVKLVGVGINHDVTKLRNDYGLECGGQLELGALAVERLQRKELKHGGLKGLAMEILGFSLSKPKKISTSNWASRMLQEGQIRYACIDAYVSFAIGKKLLEPGN